MFKTCTYIAIAQRQILIGLKFDVGELIVNDYQLRFNTSINIVTILTFLAFISLCYNLPPYQFLIFWTSYAARADLIARSCGTFTDSPHE
jgi:hypothetical protein